MPNLEIEKATTIYSIVIDNQRFPVDEFYINSERNGYVVVRSLLTTELIKVAFKKTRNKKHYNSFQVWDYSRERTIWHLRLVSIKYAREKDNNSALIHFEYYYTLLERIVAAALDRNGARFLPQVRIGNFLVDFFIEPNIVIEVDGPIHESDEQREKDQNRERELRSYGFKVERIRSHMVENLSIALVSGELRPINSDEEQRLEDLDTCIRIIIAKKDIKSEYQEWRQEYINKEKELRSYVDDELQNETDNENFEG